MAEQITRKQFKELLEAYECHGDQVFIEKLEKYTGISRKPYTSYSYYDAGGNYIGDSDDFDLFDVITNAGIEIVDPVKVCAVCGAPYAGRCCPNCGASEVEDEE